MSWGRERRAALAIAVVFFVNGTVFAGWIPRIPEVQARLGLGAGTLGLVLGGVGLGGLIGTVLSPRLIARWGSRRCAVVAGAGAALTLPTVAVAPNAWTLAAVLVTAGASDAVTDIAMNDLGVRVQRRAGRSIMNRLHAAWSLGTLSSAALATAVASLGIGVGTHLLLIGLAGSALLVGVAASLPSERATPRPPSGRRVRLGVAAVLLPLAYAAAVVESVPGEWSGVFLADVHGLGAGAVGLGFTLFAAGMLAGRLVGDRITDRVGATVTWRLAAAVMAAGLLVTVTSPTAAVAVAGFGLLGVGASVLFPVIYGMAGSLSVVSSQSGLALMSVGARIGFLSGPPLVGALADASDLRVALGVLVVAGLLVMAGLRARLEPYHSPPG